MRIILLVPRHFQSSNNLKTDRIWQETGLPVYQAQNYWYKALKSLGHTTKLFIYSSSNPTLDYYSIFSKDLAEKFKIIRPVYHLIAKNLLPIYNRQLQLLSLVKNFQPDIIILSGNTDNIFHETLLQIKKSNNIKLVLFNGLSPVLFATKTEKKAAEIFDYVCTNDFYHAIDWKMLGAKKTISLPVSAIDPETCKPYTLTPSEKSMYASDVSFVGSFSPYSLYRDRIAVLEQLTAFNLKIWTYDKNVILSHPRLKRYYAGEASNIKMFKIFQAAKINLNFHGHTMPAGGNMRTFEILGSGGFEIVDRTNPDWYKIGKEIVSFEDTTDLKEKIRYYLKHESVRHVIAQAGHKRTIKDHTYKNRFKKMLQLLST